MATTKHGNTIGAATSQYRIQCHQSSILIGDREFVSATEALEAYLQQYEHQGLLSSKSLPHYKRTVNDLLDPKSPLKMTAERSLQTGIRGTETEMRLADTKDAINESLMHMKKNVALKAQVDEALNKSQELIKQIGADNFPSTTDCPSDIGSLATDVLVTMNPTEGYKDPGGGEPPSWKSRHVFGYKRPRSRRAKTMSSIEISHDLIGLLNDKPTQNFTGQPADKSPHVTFREDDLNTSVAKRELGHYDDDVSVLLGDSLGNSSRLSRSPSKRMQERSRSVSPSILKHERKLYESGLRDKPVPDYYTDFNVSIHKTPSWIDTMNTSDVSDTDWNKRDFTTSRPPPSWINDMDSSDITSVISPSKPTKTLQLHDLLRPLPVINAQAQDSSYSSDVNDTLPPPGLTYRDLVGDTSKLVNTQNANKQKTRPTSPSLSEKLENLKSKTTSVLQRYHERQADVQATPTGMETVPRCSSLNKAAKMAGVPPPGINDITGASSIVPGDSESMLGYTSPSKPSRRPHSPDTDIILDGDRPWEKTAPFKAPVSMQPTAGLGTSTTEMTYSGGSQPGSLEALKNMIFKLQQEAVHTDSEDEGSRNKLSERVHKLRSEAASLGISVNPTHGDTAQPPGDTGTGPAPGDIPALKGYNFRSEPGGQSLEKALTHLDRLKTLVNNTQQGSEQTQADGAAGVTPLCSFMENK